MTITRRLGIGYSCLSAACLVLVAWLAYHEFIEEPAEFAAKGRPDLHKDTQAELSTVCFLALVPAVLGLGWWWIRRVLAPLETLANAVENIHARNLREPLPRTMSGDDVDKLTAAFNAMTARLDESFRQIHEFTLHASHELKTPLTVMRAQLETVIRESPAPPPGQPSWIESQLDELTRLTKIVDSLTLLTKADIGLVQLEQQPVPIRELLEEAFENTQSLGQPLGLKVSLDAGLEDVSVAGDRHRLRQLLLILADNAVKYNRPNGTISMTLRKVANAAEIRITNTGGNIAPATLGKLFDRFVRGENAKGQVEGCGLGLTIAQWIAHAHGGTIQLSQDSEDRFTALVIMPTFSATETVPRPGKTETFKPANK